MKLVALAMATGLAGPALAHGDFPPEWCGGEDCRFAAPGEVSIEGEFYRVALPSGPSVDVPLASAPLWEGCRIALCIHREGDRLNRCNPAKGECPDGASAFGLLIPAWHVFPELGEDCAEAEAEQALSHAGLASPRPVSQPSVSQGPRGRGPGVLVFSGGSGGIVYAERPGLAPVPLPWAAGLLGGALAALFALGFRRGA